MAKRQLNAEAESDYYANIVHARPGAEDIPLTRVAEAIASLAGSATALRRKNRANLLRLIQERGPHCEHCGQPIKLAWLRKGVDPQAAAHLPDTATFDHEVTKSRGGTRHYQNGILSCVQCNAARDDLPINTFRDLLRAHPALGSANQTQLPIRTSGSEGH